MDSQRIQREAAKVDPITLMLMKAAGHGFTPEAECLRNDGADINGFNNRTEKAPLVLASENGHTENAHLLMTSKIPTLRSRESFFKKKGTNRWKIRTRQSHCLNQDKMYSKVASSHGINFKHFKLANSHGSKARGPNFASISVSKVRRVKDTSSHGSKVKSHKDARSPVSNDRCNKWNLGSGPRSGESQALPVPSAFSCYNSFKRVVTDTTGTASTDITETESTDITEREYEDITVGEYTNISGTKSTDINKTESTNISGTAPTHNSARESTESNGAESTAIADKINPYKINETFTYTFQMEHSHRLANLLDECIANLRSKERTNDVTKDDKIKDVQKTVELSDCSSNKVLSCDDLLSFNNVPNASSGPMQGANGISDNQKSPIVFKWYNYNIERVNHIEHVDHIGRVDQIGHVDHAHLQNPSYVNITNTKYCVIDEKTSTI